MVVYVLSRSLQTTSDNAMVPTPTHSKSFYLAVRLQAIVNIALPTYSYIHFALFWYGNEVASVTIFAIPVLLFIIFMQLVSASQHEMDLQDLWLGLLLPFIFLGGSAILRGLSPAWFLFEQGALYISAIMLSYVWIVFIRPVLSGSIWRWGKDFWFNVLASFAQLFFLVPGLVTMGFFVHLLWMQDVWIQAGLLPLAQWTKSLNIWVFWGTLLQLSRHEYRWMHKAAPEL